MNRIDQNQKTELSHSGPEWSKNIQKLITFLSMGIFSNLTRGLGKIKRGIRTFGQFDIKS